MALIEILTVELGGSLVKALAKLWLKDVPIIEDISGDATDALLKRIGDFQTRRSTEKLFRDLPDRIAERLIKVVEVEFPSMPENDSTAAALAVSTVFDGLQLDRTVVAADLDPTELEKRLLASARDAFRTLGTRPSDLGHVLLRECCNYVVRLADKMPAFQAAATREILKRERELLDGLTVVLDQVAALRVESSTTATTHASAFELQYRRAVVRRLDRLELFGLRLVTGDARSYGLSIAYVTLAAVHGLPPKSGRVDDVLQGLKYTLVRGEAGSGKTTLLQWLAVRAANRDFSGALAQLSDLIPFYIRLRDHATERRLPKPEEYISGTARNLSELAPRGWTHEALASGALLLVDGIDELPANRRSDFVEWLKEIQSDFPKTSIVVSSRPACIDADNRRLASELERHHFTSVELESMNQHDSDALIAQWHAAVGRDREGEHERLREYEQGLRKALRDRPAVRSLASNPLLCAMMCALNWDRREDLPSNRMELYSAALEMLLDRRDRERKVQAAHLPDLGKEQKEFLLDSLAYWMMRNGETETGKEEATQQIARDLPRLAQVPQDSELVLQELLERSGVLREPQHGRVDFIHRTFLEFMGARAAVRMDDLGAMAARASENNWREAIVFAAGHATGKRRDRLIRDLLKHSIFQRRTTEQEVTAACCLETVGTNLDPQLMAELKDVARGLFPPQDRATAALLAPAAAMDPELLEGHADADEEAIAGCIRTASVIGGDRMLKVIQGYIPPRSYVVQAELARAWTAFGDDAFAERVLRPCRKFLNVPVGDLSPDAFRCFKLLVELEGLTDISFVPILRKFESEGHLDLWDVPDRPLGSKLAAPSIWFRQLSTRPAWFKLPHAQRLARLEKLRKLSIVHIDAAALSVIARLQLDTLRLTAPPGTEERHESLRELAACSTLLGLTLRQFNLRDLRWISALTKLRHINLRNVKSGSDLSPLTTLPDLESVLLWDFPKSSAGWLATMRKLRNLDLIGVDFSEPIPLSSMPHLSDLFVWRGSANSLAELERAQGLVDLHISRPSDEFASQRLNRVPPRTKRLTLTNWKSLDCRLVSGGVSLETIVLRDVQKLQNFDILFTLPKLRQLACNSTLLLPFRGKLADRGIEVLDPSAISHPEIDDSDLDD